MNYSLNTDTFNKQFLPPTKRKDKAEAWGRVLLNGVQWARDLFFDDYINGNTDWRVQNYNAGITYNVGDFVYYTDGIIYECTAVSTGNLPTNVLYFSIKSFAVLDRINFIDKAVYECILVNPTGIGALNTTYWIKIQNEFLGIRERSKANAQILLFEYMLNKWFGTSFNYPSSVNDIYIVNNSTASETMIMGRSGPNSSFMPRSSTFQANFLTRSYVAQTTSYYTIYVPLAVFNSLASTNDDRENIIRDFANKFNLSGVTYTVTTY